jgi:hypothetical protein
MGQMLSGGAPAPTPMPTPTDVGYTPAGPVGAVSGPSSGGTPAGPGPAGGTPGTFVNNVGFLQRVGKFFGDTQEEREKNAKAFAALTKDLGGIGRTMSESSLMQRMMKEQMAGEATMIPGGSPAGGIAAIPRTFDPGTAQGIMSQLGFK